MTLEDLSAARGRQVRGATEAVDREAHNLLAEPRSAAGQRLGGSEPERPRVPALGVNSIDGEKALLFYRMILDGHLVNEIGAIFVPKFLQPVARPVVLRSFLRIPDG